MKIITRLSAAVLAGVAALSASAVEVSEINSLYVMGAVETGWSMGGTSLNKVENGVFSGQIVLTTGDFKFNYEKDNWGAWVYSTVENKDVVLNEPMGLTLTEPGGDYKWISSTAGAYLLTVDLNAGTLTVADSPEIYMIGGATPGGWSLGDAIALKRVDGQTYKGTVNLGTGEFKFLAGRNFECSITATEGDAAVAVGEAMPANYASSGDNKWNNGEAGQYVVTVTLGNNPTVTLAKNDKPFVPTAFTATGSALNAELSCVADGIFKYCGKVEAGTYAVSATDGTDTRWLKVNGGAVEYVAAQTDATVFETTASDIQLTVNVAANTLVCNTFVPYETLYVVGSFTGWSFVEMTKVEDNVFTWNGDIDPETQGDEIKFSAVNNFDQGEYMLHPYVNAQPLADADYCYSGGADNKWKVTEAKHYSITVNALMQTVKVETSALSAVEAVETGAVRVEAGAVVVEGNDAVAVYNLAGRRIAAAAAPARIALEKGVYLVKVGENTVKVAL